MLTLYYSPGACSLASHITLEESGAAYEPQPILLSKGENKSETYLKINPRGKERMLRRPAVRKILERERNLLVQAA